ncbi:PLC-like phosphodiesterase [Xylariaceae sp. FL1272]|nr:PLC-like phosphodiesterase [Xylariaceae sp. FL1272]
MSMTRRSPLTKRRHTPLGIAHRGFNATIPENTMMAFKAAVEVGVDALETDLHLSRDGVVVLCHDGSLKRTFGRDAKVKDLDWAELSQLRTLREPHLPMPRLSDLLAYLDEPGLEDIWLMLDIKRDDDPEEMMRSIALTIDSTPGRRPWSERVTPCCWNANYINLSMKYLPAFHVTFLGVSIKYARQLTNIPNISFSIVKWALASPCGTSFIRDMKKLGLPVYVWTLNDEYWMEWAIRKQLAGVITDQVARYNDVRDRVDDKEENGRLRTRTKGRRPISSTVALTLRFWAEIALFQSLITVFMTIDRVKNGSPKSQVRKALKN